MTSNTDKRLILLNEADNIFVCCQQVSAGEIVTLEGDKVAIPTDIELGHKLARKDIEAGGKILKYGVPIGSAITDIQRAEHVHTRNLESDYIPSHSRSGSNDKDSKSPEKTS